MHQEAGHNEEDENLSGRHETVEQIEESRDVCSISARQGEQIAVDQLDNYGDAKEHYQQDVLLICVSVV